MIYVLQITPGAENKVLSMLKGEGIQAYVPKRELIIRKSGGWTREIHIMFPAYVFVECDYCPEVHYKVKSNPYVLRWLGDPTPITGAEAEFMQLMFNEGMPIPESAAFVDNERNVTITGGWLCDKQQYIRGFNIRKKRALLEVRFDGKKHRTSVSVEFTRTKA